MNLGENSRYARSGPTSLQQDCLPDLEQHRSLQQDCLRVIAYGRFHMWSNIAATRLGMSIDTDYTALYPRTEPLWWARNHVGLGNQISEIARLMRTEKKKTMLVKSQECARPETWETEGLDNNEESWRKFKICQIWTNTAATGLCLPDLEQHRSLQQDRYVLFRSADSRCGATPMLRECVRVNSFGTGSQHVPDLDQQPYHTCGLIRS